MNFYRMARIIQGGRYNSHMDSAAIAALTPRLEEVEEIIRLYAGLFHDLGFENGREDAGDSRQITFDNRVLINNNSLSLAVVVIPEVGSRTFNFEYSNLTSEPSGIRLNDREVRRVVVQLVESKTYRQLSMQVYFRAPINYQMEDLIFRCKVEQMAGGPRVKLGVPWIPPEVHMPASAALDLTSQIRKLLKIV
jgi:hypothetical protein